MDRRVPGRGSGEYNVFLENLNSRRVPGGESEDSPADVYLGLALLGQLQAAGGPLPIEDCVDLLRVGHAPVERAIQILVNEGKATVSDSPDAPGVVSITEQGRHRVSRQRLNSDVSST